jgi:hypothetical protein
MNLDHSLQPLSERGSEPSDRKQRRSAEAGDKRGSDWAPPGEARQDASSEFRGSRFQYAKNTMQRKPRFRDMRNHESITAVKRRSNSGPLIPVCVGVSWIGISICKEHNATKTSISRYAKSRLNPDRQIQK